ncbi:MAG: DUF2194 domain-containing protein [Ruminococcaceae bacterium]|nr:DUF2194 domain-containing protein [Oscillospiraceae bacterium]
MGELIKGIRRFKFKGILVILFVFSLIALILLVELSGIRANRYDKSLELLPQSKILTKEESLAALDKNALFIHNSKDVSSSMAYEQFSVILADMKVGHIAVDVGKDALPSFDSFSQVIVLLADLTPLGQQMADLCDFVHEGGAVWFPLVLETNVYSSAISQMIGIDDLSPDYYTVEAIYPQEDFMLGGGRAFAVSDPFESSLTVVLSDDAEVYANAEGPDGVPLVWKKKYGNGVFVVDNIGIYDKAMRGFYAASYSLLSDVCVYPVINASTFYLDDFPSQIPSGNSEYIQRDYHTTIRDFYINIWWPDMMNFADEYGLKYTGLAIESYDNHVDGTADATPDTGTFLNFGNMLLRKGGELGYHGYNHQPLVLSNKDYQDHYDYKTWQSEDAMKSAFDELIELCDTLFPDADFSLYVPPSNLLSDEGRAFLIKEYPHIKTISGIYFDDMADAELDFGCTQEFSVDENGVVDQPRVVYGFIMDDFLTMAAISELNFHFVNSHFTHPDDALDPERGAELGWGEMKRRFDGYLSWLYDSAPGLRNLTGTEASAAVQRFAAVSPKTEYNEDGVKMTIGHFYDEAQFLVRFNEKLPDHVTGGELTHLTGSLYLLRAESDTVDITLK